MDLPEVFERVASFLSDDDLMICVQVCRYWRDICEPYQWRTASENRGPWCPILTAIHASKEGTVDAARATLAKYRNLVRHVDSMSLSSVAELLFMDVSQGREQEACSAMGKFFLRTLMLDDTELYGESLRLAELELSELVPVPLEFFDRKVLDIESRINKTSIVETAAGSWALWQIILQQRHLERLEFDRRCHCIQFLDFRPPGFDKGASFDSNLLGPSSTGMLSSPGSLLLKRVLESLPRLYHLGLPDHKNILPVLQVVAAFASSSTTATETATTTSTATGSGIRSLSFSPFTLPIYQDTGDSSVSEWLNSCQHLINPKVRTLSLVHISPGQLSTWMKVMPSVETLTIWPDSYRDPFPENPWNAFLRAREAACSSPPVSTCASVTTPSSSMSVFESFSSATADEEQSKEGLDCWTRNKTVQTLTLMLWGISLVETELIWESLVDLEARRQNLHWGFDGLFDRMPALQKVRLGGDFYCEKTLASGIKTRFKSLAVNLPPLLSIKRLEVETILNRADPAILAWLPRMPNLVRLELWLICDGPVLEVIADHCLMLERLTITNSGKKKHGPKNSTSALHKVLVQCSRLRSLRGRGLEVRGQDMALQAWTCLNLRELEVSIMGIPLLSAEEIQLLEEHRKQGSESETMEDKGEQERAEERSQRSKILHGLRRYHERSLAMQRQALAQLGRLTQLEFLNLSPCIGYRTSYVRSNVQPSTLDWTLASGLNLLGGLSELRCFAFPVETLHGQEAGNEEKSEEERQRPFPTASVQWMLDHWPKLITVLSCPRSLLDLENQLKEEILQKWTQEREKGTPATLKRLRGLVSCKCGPREIHIHHMGPDPSCCQLGANTGNDFRYRSPRIAVRRQSWWGRGGRPAKTP